MSATELRWVPFMEWSELKKVGWRDVLVEGRHHRDGWTLMVSPPPASEEKVTCPNCGDAVEQPWLHFPGGWRCPTLPAKPERVEAERVETTKTVAYCDELDARYGKPAATVEISELDDRHMRMASPEAQKKFKAMAGIVDVGMNHLVGVATEPTPSRKMPEVICDAAFWLNQVADGFEYDDNDLRALAERVHRWWRTYVHLVATDRYTCVCPDCRQWDDAQPVAMSNDLLFVLNAALHSANNDKGWAPDYAEQIRAAHRAVVAQYGRKP